VTVANDAVWFDCSHVCTAVVVLSSRDQIQSGGQGIIMTSARRLNSGSRSSGSQLSGANYDEDRNDELYSRNIEPWRPDISSTEARPSQHDIQSAYERQPVMITGASRVS